MSRACGWGVGAQYGGEGDTPCFLPCLVRDLGPKVFHGSRGGILYLIPSHVGALEDRSDACSTNVGLGSRPELPGTVRVSGQKKKKRIKSVENSHFNYSIYLPTK